VRREQLDVSVMAVIRDEENMEAVTGDDGR
jgi:hypothetical protein